MGDKIIRGFLAEKIARRKLEKQLQAKFAVGRSNRTIVVAYRSNGQPVNHEFDLVSENGQILGEIKSDKYTQRAHANTRLPRMLLACRYSELASARRKLFVLTNRQMYERLKIDLGGIVDSQIEILFVDVNSGN